MIVSRIEFSIDLVLGFVSWFFLCSAIAVFNSYYDKDEKPVAGLENPPTTAFSMIVGAWLMKISGFIIALFLNKMFLTVYITGVILSILYSHKKFRFKSNGYIAVFLNFVVGVITFLAASSFLLPSLEILFFGSATAGSFLAAIYLMMQVHQKEEDKTRKDISIMVLYGRKMTIIFVIVFMIVAAILSMISFVMSNYKWFYILILIIYFATILFFSYAWLKKQEESMSDFKIMNKLTMRLSYAANIVLAIVYIFEIALKN
jgi:4-hydroxybenzoate polyprenyltransferase